MPAGTGDISAITPYLKALDRLDRYQTVASANQVYDDEARKKLLDKINRVAENLGIDEVMWAAVQEHLKEIGQISADEPDEVEAEAADPAGSSGSTAVQGARYARGEDCLYAPLQGQADSICSDLRRFAGEWPDLGPRQPAVD
jgi:hypothetical protein